MKIKRWNYTIEEAEFLPVCNELIKMVIMTWQVMCCVLNMIILTEILNMNDRKPQD
jgi:hypothetical protein